jgi:primary-amine oxidase
MPALRTAASATVVAFLLGSGLARAQFFPRQAVVDPPSQEVVVEFPVGDAGGLEPRKATAWKVHFSRGLHKGLYITGAWFKRHLGEDWIKILNDVRVAELFVPYHQSNYIRYFDLTGFSFPLAQVREEDAGPNGTLLPPFPGDAYPTVVKEIRDRGVVWKDYAHGVRRGKELVIWGALEAGNYMYLMSYGFHDDGTISLRVGATGQNLPGHRMESHTHNAHWRIDIDLIDGKKNSAMVMRHVEQSGGGLGAEDLEEPFNRGYEGGLDWEPKEFTMIRVASNRKNAGGKTIAYDLMPVRMGSSRHAEEFTRHDFWVTQSHPDRPLEYIFSNLPAIVKDEEPVESADIVLWGTSTAHHEPRDEDGKPNSGPRFWPGDDAWEGSALVMWSGFDLRPRNFFDRTPFYPYSPPPALAAPRGPDLRQQEEGAPPAPERAASPPPERSPMDR